MVQSTISLSVVTSYIWSSVAGLLLGFLHFRFSWCLSIHHTASIIVCPQIQSFSLVSSNPASTVSQAWACSMPRRSKAAKPRASYSVIAPRRQDHSELLRINDSSTPSMPYVSHSRLTSVTSGYDNDQLPRSILRSPDSLKRAAYPKGRSRIASSLSS